MSDEELIARLRDADRYNAEHYERDQLHKQSADRIEELESANKRLNEQMDAIEEMGTESLNALPDCLMRLAPALVENGELKAKLAKAVEALNGCIVAIEHANMADGVCCCGDNMEGHSEPMNCGHSPVDMGEYHAYQVLTAARTALRAIGGEE